MKYLDFEVVDIDSVRTPFDEWPPKYQRAEVAGCAMCGKPVGKAPLYILACGGGLSTIANKDDDAQLEAKDGGYMGCHPVGSECAKRIRTLVRGAGLDPDKYLFKVNW